jgi:translocation protein SEC63
VSYLGSSYVPPPHPSPLSNISLLPQGRWWFSQRGITKDGALSSTAEIFFHDLSEDITLSGLLGLLASAVEVREVLAKRAGKSKKEKRARAAQTDELEKTLIVRAKESGLQERDLFNSIVATAPARRASLLLWSHLLRYDDLSADMLEGERHDRPRGHN